MIKNDHITAGSNFYKKVSSRLLSKNSKIVIYKTIILPVVQYGCETWSLTLREESRLWIIEKGSQVNIWAQEG